MVDVEKPEGEESPSENWQGWKDSGGIGRGKYEDSEPAVWKGDGKERSICAVYDYSGRPHMEGDELKFAVEVINSEGEYDPETEQPEWWLVTCKSKEEATAKAAKARELYSKIGPDWAKIEKQLEEE